MRQLAKYIIFFIPIFCYTQDYLLSNEKKILGFEKKNGKQLIIALDTKENYLVYRFGTKNNIEFEFPKDLTKSWGEFYFSWYSRGGGIQNEGIDLNYLYFDNGNYRYVIFQKYTAREQKTKYEIKVINRKTKKETIINAEPSTVTGTLSIFRDLKKIKEGDTLF